jgi:hypothetical protein
MGSRPIARLECELSPIHARLSESKIKANGGWPSTMFASVHVLLFISQVRLARNLASQQRWLGTA